MRVRAFLAALLLTGQAAAGEPILVAVASNFAQTAAQLAERFEEQTGTAVRLSSGSTGKLYAQVVNGAPYDVFLAADAARPAILERSGHAVPGSRRTYAIGRLVIYSTRADDCLAVLQDPDAGHIAIANPDTAPYGAAARDFLRQAGLWEAAQPRLVTGENIAQVLQFVASGNAELGFIAHSQLRAPSLPEATCSWRVPASSPELAAR